jgi:D-glutamate cyclase
MATRVATDVHVAAGVSNWGAYGIAACLAALLGRPELLHDAEIERFMLHESVRTGAGGGGLHPLSVDGLPLTVHIAVLELMRSVVVEGLKPARHRGF